MRFSAVQLLVDGQQQPESRKKAACVAVREEADRGAELVLLPEMWLPGFFGFSAYEQLAEPLDGPTATMLSLLAAECRVHLCAGSIVERDADGFYNTALMFGPDGSLLTSYRKIHLFGYGSEERARLSRGSTVVTCDIGGIRAGISTCYDLRFPELYRAAVDQGAECFLVVAAWPFPRVDAWRCLARARAIENQASLVGANASGRQGNGVFAGGSLAFDPWGTPQGELDDRPGVLRGELDKQGIDAARAEFSALRDRVLDREA